MYSNSKRKHRKQGISDQFCIPSSYRYSGVSPYLNSLQCNSIGSKRQIYKYIANMTQTFEPKDYPLSFRKNDWNEW